MDAGIRCMLTVLTTYCNLDVFETRPTLAHRLHQFIRQIFSSDNVLQLITPEAIPLLVSYSDGDEPDDKLGPLVPAFGMIQLNLGNDAASRDVEALLRVICGVLARRAEQVFEKLKDSRKWVKKPPMNWEAANSELDWERTGCYYGKPPFRPRPFYEGKDTEVTGNFKDEGSCRKLYTTYGKKALTGGLMALWCPHLVCLGFHKIPVAEGRNDVFSAIYKYWEVAPKTVIYDFACQLGPYCMTREPEFFKDTLFAIDEMHANGHTHCSQACFVSNYMQVRSHLMPINSSAAECSNSGLSRIRKSISYMDQTHAVLYTYVYLSVWNRKRQLKAKADLGKMLIDTKRR